MTYLSKTRDQLNLQTAYQQEQIETLVTDNQKVPVYANYNRIENVDVDDARTVLSRDYKGFGTSKQTSTGVIEKDN